MAFGVVTGQAAKSFASGSPPADPALTYAANVTAHNMLFAAIAASGVAPVTFTISDTLNNTWVPIDVLISGGASSSFVRSWYVADAIGGADTVTITLTATTTACEMVIAEFSGVQTSSPLDAHGNASSGSAGTTATSANLVTGTASEVLIGFLPTTSGANPATLTPLQSETSVINELNGAAAGVFDLVYRVVSATGTYTITETIDSSNWDIQAGTFKLIAAAGGVFPPDVEAFSSITSVLAHY